MDGAVMKISNTDADGNKVLKYEDSGETLVCQEDFVTDTHAIQSSYTYDPKQQLIAQTDSFGNTITNSYDLKSRLTTTFNPDFGYQNFTYDLHGNIIAKITSNLRTLGPIKYSFYYDQLVAVNFPVYSENDITFEWGAPGSPYNRAGRIFKVQDNTGEVVYQYDSLGNKVTANRTLQYSIGTAYVDNFVKYANFSYFYDSWGRIINMTYPDGEVVHYSFNDGGRVDAVYGILNGTTYRYVDLLAYNEKSQKVKIVYGNGAETSYTYDVMNWPVSQTLTVPRQTLLNATFTNSLAGHVTYVENSIPPADPSLFTVGGPMAFHLEYDGVYRTINAHGVYKSNNLTFHRFNMSMGYNDINALTSKHLRQHKTIEEGDQEISHHESSLGSYQLEYSYGSTFPHAPVQIDENYSPSVRRYCISYDANGNHAKSAFVDFSTANELTDVCSAFVLNQSSISAIHRTNEWDERDYLRSITDRKAGKVEISYDHSGARSLKNGNEGLSLYYNQYYSEKRGRTTKAFFVDGEMIAAKELTNSGRCGTENKGVDETGCQYFIHSFFNSPQWITNARGNPVSHYEYIPESGEKWVFESFLENAAPVSTQNYPFGYKFQEYDETNLYFDGKKYVDPHLNIKM